MSPWWLLLIVPLFTVVGFLFGEILGSSKELDRLDAQMTRLHRQEPTDRTVMVRARRDIPRDVWLDKIMSTDAKTAQAHLRLSMAQQLASQAAQHVAIGYVFDQIHDVYKVWGDMRVLPLEEWK